MIRKLSRGRPQLRAAGPRFIVTSLTGTNRAVGPLLQTSLQQRPFTTGPRLIRHPRYFTLQLAESYLTRSLFRQILQRIERLGWYPT